MQPPIRFKKTGEITIEPETDVNPKKPGLFGQSAQTHYDGFHYIGLVAHHNFHWTQNCPKKLH